MSKIERPVIPAYAESSMWITAPMNHRQADCNEMKKLKRWLKDRGVKYECYDDYDQVRAIARIHFKINGCKWSCIHGYGTQGGRSCVNEKDPGLLELYALNRKNDPIGFLTAEEVIKIVGEEKCEENGKPSD